MIRIADVESRWLRETPARLAAERMLKTIQSTILLLKIAPAPEPWEFAMITMLEQVVAGAEGREG